MVRRSRGRVLAGFLSTLLPGAGQLYAGARRAGLALLAVSAALVAGAATLAVARPFDLASVVDARAVAAIVAADVALLGFRLFAVVDAWRRGPGAATRVAVVGLAALAALTAAPHVAAGYVTVRGYGVLDSVFADDEPRDVLAAHGVFLMPPRPPAQYPRRLWPGGVSPSGDPPPRRRVQPKPLASAAVLPGERPWVTLLLLGSDRGPGNWGERTDTMIVVAIQRGTGRAAAFGIPRNLVDVPVGGAAAEAMKRFREPLNSLYAFGRARPELFPGGADPGATAVKQTISRLLGLRVDYYALVDLVGFADMVDALGGVDIHVKERLVDSVTRPAWGEPKPTIDVFPGRTYHFFGREALAYVRSRKTSSDYTRMARQRCFLSALARQVEAVDVLRHFSSLAATVERSVRTDIPLDRVPDLLRLATGVKPRLTSTETFGVAYFARRRSSDRYPIPAVARIQERVRTTILDPAAVASGRVTSVQRSC
jgi:LCP family protein required for cell wall assembly